MGIEASIAALAVLGGLGATTNYLGSQEKNRSLKKAAASARNAAALQERQLSDQGAVESEKAIRQSRAIRARAVVGAADSGFSLESGDVDSLLAAIDADAGLNLDIIGDNTRANQALVGSRLAAQLNEFKSQEESPFGSAFKGLLGGAGTAFQLIAGANALNSEGTPGTGAGLAPETAKMKAANSVG